MSTITAPVFGEIPIELIRPSKTNPRKRFDQAALDDLAKSIKEQGLGQPILVRPLPNTKDTQDCVEIVAGERRYRASKIAGLKSIPAIVRVMSDVDSELFQQVENLQREDVHPIEEAEGYERLMRDHKLTAEDCAEKVGKSKAYIYARLKLCALIPDARAAFYDGKLTASTALLLARIPVPTLQAKATDEVVNSWNGSPMSYRQASDHIQRRYMLDLAGARFSISDAKLLPAAGACTACPKRTGNAPDLFTDVKSADVCIDPDCFAAKRTALDEKTLSEAKKKGIPVFEIKHSYEASNKWPDLVALDDSLWKFDRADDSKHGQIEDLLPADKLPKPVQYVKLENGDVEPLFEKTAMQEALEKAGLCLTIDQHTAAMKEKLKEKKANPKLTDAQKKEIEFQEELNRQAEMHTKYRTALYRAIRNEINTETPSIDALRIVAKSIVYEWAFPSDLQDLYQFNPNVSADCEAFIDQASISQIIILMLEFALDSIMTVDTYDFKHGDPEEDELYQQMLTLSLPTNVNAKALRDQIITSAPAQEKTPAKKAGKTKAKPKAADPAIDIDGETEDESTESGSSKGIAAWPFPTGSQPKAKKAAKAKGEPA